METPEELKIPYEPVEDRRFKISLPSDELPEGSEKDSYSIERVNTLKQILGELSLEFPEIRMALSISGSLSKGKRLGKDNAAFSDIDADFFFDEDDLRKNHHILYARNIEYREIFDTLLEQVKEGGNADYANIEAGSQIPEKPTEPIPVYNQKSGLACITIKALIAKKIKTEFEENKRSAYQKRYGDHVAVDHMSMDPKNNYSLMSYVAKSLGDRGPSSFGDDESKNFQIAYMFALNPGGGLKPYIQEFLLQLDRMEPMDAQRYWEYVDKTVRRAERRDSIPDSIERLFPKTFEEAKKYYGLGEQ